MINTDELSRPNQALHLIPKALNDGGQIFIFGVSPYPSMARLLSAEYEEQSHWIIAIWDGTGHYQCQRRT
jgi:hypothetical protein